MYVLGGQMVIFKELVDCIKEEDFMHGWEEVKKMK